MRSYDGSEWTGWEDNNFVYYGSFTTWLNGQVDVTDKLVQNPQKVQIAFGELIWRTSSNFRATTPLRRPSTTMSTSRST